MIDKLGLAGVIQLASFHPGYQFAVTDPDAVENYTNRSPYPMLHLLREESISQVADDPEELAEYRAATSRRCGRWAKRRCWKCSRRMRTVHAPRRSGASA